MPKSTTCTTFSSPSIGTKNLTDNLFLICRTNSNIATKRRNRSKDVKKRSFERNNNGRIMNLKYRGTSNCTIRQNTNNTNISKCASPTKSLYTYKIKNCMRKANTKKKDNKSFTFSSTYFNLFICNLLFIESLFKM
jgi:hypothetical protein